MGCWQSGARVLRCAGSRLRIDPGRPSQPGDVHRRRCRRGHCPNGTRIGRASFSWELSRLPQFRHPGVHGPGSIGAPAERERWAGRHPISRLWPRAGPARRVKADKIYLVGFMAAGKTTLARALARRLDWQAVDIDELIEQREHMTGRRHLRAARRAVLPGARTRRCSPISSRPSRRRRDRRRHVRRPGRIAPPSTPTACRSGSTSRSTASIARCRPTAAGRWPPIAPSSSTCIIAGAPPTSRRTSGSMPAAPACRAGRAGRRLAGRLRVDADAHADWVVRLRFGISALALSTSHALPRPDRHSRQPRGARRLPRRRRAARVRPARCARRPGRLRRRSQRGRSNACSALEPVAIVRGNHDKVACGLEQADGFNAVAKSAARWTLDVADAGAPRPGSRSCRRVRSRSTMSVRDLPRIAVRRGRVHLRRARRRPRAKRRRGRSACSATRTIPSPSSCRAMVSTASASRRRRERVCSCVDGSKYLVNPGVGRSAARRRSARGLRDRRRRRALRGAVSGEVSRRARRRRRSSRPGCPRCWRSGWRWDGRRQKCRS